MTSPQLDRARRGLATHPNPQHWSRTTKREPRARTRRWPSLRLPISARSAGEMQQKQVVEEAEPELVSQQQQNSMRPVENRHIWAQVSGRE
jgi:hypothetical protein